MESKVSVINGGMVILENQAGIPIQMVNKNGFVLNTNSIINTQTNTIVRMSNRPVEEACSA